MLLSRTSRISSPQCIRSLSAYALNESTVPLVILLRDGVIIQVVAKRSPATTPSRSLGLAMKACSILLRSCDSCVFFSMRGCPALLMPCAPSVAQRLSAPLPVRQNEARSTCKVLRDQCILGPVLHMARAVAASSFHAMKRCTRTRATRLAEDDHGTRTARRVQWRVHGRAPAGAPASQATRHVLGGQFGNDTG